VGHLEEEVNEYKVLVGEPESKGPKHRWEDKNKMILKKFYGTVWTGLIWLRIRTSGRLL
jgi:hypothetical protein